MSQSTLVDLLRARAEEHGDRLAYIHLEDGVAENQRWTYGDLHLRAMAVAANLQRRFRPGDRALLLYPTGLEMLAGFFGCLYAGLIAIPAPPPEASRLKRTGPRLRAIARDATAAAVLTTTKLHDLIVAADPPVFEPGTVEWVATDAVGLGAAAGWRTPLVQGSDLAYLQYTSGSTSTPKGVMIGHRSVCFHLGNLQRHCGYDADSVTVTWMPYFHDYGLVEGLLEPLHNATPCYVMSPFAFIKRPVSWLKAITAYRGTHSQAPNFAYDLCARRINPPQRDGLDLRHWRSAGNAAEPINPRVMRAFHDAFQACGFRWETFCPAYGLAEATLLVCSSPTSGEPLLLDVDADQLEENRASEIDGREANARTIVGCGRIFDTTRVAIVDPATLTRCAEGQVGEIWVSDPAVGDGYWQRPDDTRETFQAYTSEPREGPFLRTGDLGFILRGELFIGGRLKDLIIIRGTNHYPQDIEWTVQAAHPSLRPENGAAFSILVDGQERLIVAQEVEREHVPGLPVSEVVQAIRQAVAEEHEIDVFAVLLLGRGSLPKTASAKIQRQACRSFYFEGGPEVLAGWVAPVRGGEQVPSWLLRDQGEPSAVAPVPAAPTNGQAERSAETDEALRSRRKADDLIGWLRSYASERINSRLMDERRCIPPYLILDFGNRGILGLQVPRSHEGLELRYRDALRVLEQVAAIDLNLAAVVFLHNTNGVRPIQYHARPELRDEVLPLLARGRELAAFALSEPGAGSNVGGVASLAAPQPGGGWRIRGVKRWNQGSWAGVVSVFVRVVLGDGRLGGLTGFAVRQGSPGLRIGPEALTTGLRGSVQNSILLQDVPVTERELLGELGKGMEVADDALMVGRICTAAVGLGALKRCAQLMVRYAGRRTIATGRLIDNPVTMTKLGELGARIRAIESLIVQVADLMDAGRSVPAEIAMSLKIVASEAAVWAAGELMQVLGGRGYMENNIAPQILRDARVLTVGEGPNETLGWYVGRSVVQTPTIHRFVRESLGMPALADRFEADIRELSERCQAPGSTFADRSAILSWTSYLAGTLINDGLLLAAVEKASARPGVSDDRVRAWANLRYEEAVRQANRAATGGPAAIGREQVAELASACRLSIGDIEQDLPGEEDALDPYLRQQVGKAPGSLPAGLPGEPGSFPRAEPDGDLGQARSVQGQPGLSAQEKRALLEQALRRKIAESPTVA